MLFGDCPQTIKAANVTVDETQSVTVGLYTYYKGSDGAWYMKFIEKWCGSGVNTYSDGSQAKQESQNSIRYFKVEPQKWRVVTGNYNGTGKKLLVAETIGINGMYYYGDGYLTGSSDLLDRNINGEAIHTSDYKYSCIRSILNGLSYRKWNSTVTELIEDEEYLNKGLLQTMFTPALQSNIVSTEIDNSAESTNPAGNTTLWNNGENDYVCENLTDKVFVLSMKEVTSSAYGFGSYNNADSARVRKVTDFALASGVQKSENGGGYWWLRSPYYAEHQTARISYDDFYNITGVTTNGCGIVPALCLDN